MHDSNFRSYTCQIVKLPAAALLEGFKKRPLDIFICKSKCVLKKNVADVGAQSPSMGSVSTRGKHEPAWATELAVVKKIYRAFSFVSKKAPLQEKEDPSIR